MLKSNLFVGYRIVTILLIFTALLVQSIVLNNSGGNLGNFFSYFTILSNIFAAVVLSISIVKSEPTNILVSNLRGASTLYLIITFAGFVVLLQGDQGFLLGWVNLVLHYLSPAMVLFDWILYPISVNIPFRLASIWTIPSVLYLTYSLVRGSTTLWYPYSFLNPNQSGGYLTVFGYFMGVTLFGFLCIYFLLIIINSRQKSYNMI